MPAGWAVAIKRHGIEFRRVAVLGTLLVAAGTATAGAQVLEVDLGWSMIDHDPPRNAVYNAERLPGAWSVAVRHHLNDGGTFLQFLGALGNESGPGVRTWSKVLGVGGGYSFRMASGSVDLSLRPGIDLLRVSHGQGDSWPSSWAGEWGASGSISAALGYQRPLGIPLTSSFFAGVGRVYGFIDGDDCLDCDLLLDRARTRVSVGVSVAFAQVAR